MNLTKKIKKLFRPLLLKIIIYNKGVWSEDRQIKLQKKNVNFNIKKGEKVLDIGCGGDPFPYATHLVDKFPEETQHRYNKLRTNNLPFIQADAEALPFKNKSFDFIYCSHVLEHLDHPGRACREIMRVGKRGYIETPTRTSDLLFNFIHKQNFHKWHVNLVGNSLIFHEYTRHEQIDTKINDFFYMHHSGLNNPIKKLTHQHKNLISNMFLWKDRFDCYVFNKMGQLIDQITS